jgi:hypothetical protein
MDFHKIMAGLTLHMEVNLKLKGQNICKTNANKMKFLINNTICARLNKIKN